MRVHIAVRLERSLAEASGEALGASLALEDLDNEIHEGPRLGWQHGPAGVK
jgi:hypothetical protein